MDLRTDSVEKEGGVEEKDGRGSGVIKSERGRGKEEVRGGEVRQVE